MNKEELWLYLATLEGQIGLLRCTAAHNDKVLTELRELALDILKNTQCENCDQEDDGA